VEDGLELRYRHMGLTNTAVTISELLEARNARFRAWS
jgi:hypothetical protein